MRKYQFLLLLVILIASQGSLSQGNQPGFHGIVHGAENLNHVLPRSIGRLLSALYIQFFRGKTAVIGTTTDLTSYRGMKSNDEVFLMDALRLRSPHPAATFTRNMTALRTAMRIGSGKIRDVSPMDLDNNTSSWLRSERMVLSDRGWQHDAGRLSNGRIIYTWTKP